MPAAPIIAAVGATVAVAGTVATMSAQSKMRKAQEKQFKYQRSMDTLRAARERKEAIRAARLSRGTALQSSVNQGAENTSASIGGLGSIDSQLNSGLSFLDQYNTLSDQATLQAGKVAKHQSKAQDGAAITGLGMAIFNNSGGISDSVFGKPKVK